uniref:hypothetical protein n=1 Tax=Aliarcobacter sp. TaxID=2321116 RepID=UPI0040484F1E
MKNVIKNNVIAGVIAGVVGALLLSLLLSLFWDIKKSQIKIQNDLNQIKSEYSKVIKKSEISSLSIGATIEKINELENELKQHEKLQIEQYVKVEEIKTRLNQIKYQGVNNEK